MMINRPVRFTRLLFLSTAAVGLTMVTWLAAAHAAEGSSKTRRYALVIGANQGDASDIPLRYAERDAERLADVLTRVGRVQPEDLVLLKDTDARTVTRVLRDLNRRIAALRDQQPETESMLLVFYSGHADALGLHLSGTRLLFSRLKKLLERSPAQIRVLIVDACRSGEITRVKGATAAEPFAINTDDRLAGEGMVIITSSAAGEDAQESERLQGGFFTHSFLAGLQGAADASGDRRVTLNEAYRYAYTETLRATSRAPFLQHPTYSFQLRGRDDLFLTVLRGRVSGMGRVRLKSPGTYVLFAGNERGPIAAEVTVSRPRDIVLRTGRYAVRKRGKRAAYEGSLRVREGAVTAIKTGDLRRIPYSILHRKGRRESPVRSAVAIVAGAAASGELLEQTGTTTGATLGLHLRRPTLTWELRGIYGRSQSENEVLTARHSALGVDISALRTLLGARGTGLAVALGVRAGADWVRQSFTTTGQAPQRSSLVWRGGAVVHLSYAPTPRLRWYLEAAGAAHRVRHADAAGTDGGSVTRLIPHVSTGLLLYAY